MSALECKLAVESSRLLQVVLARVLEQSAFVLTAPAQRLVGWRVQEPMHAVVRFSGCAMGWLRLTLPQSLLKSLIADRVMLAALNAEHCTRGALLCELVRGVAAQLLPLCLPARRDYELAPATLRGTAPQAIPSALRYCVMLVTESAQPVEAELVVLREVSS